MMFFAWCLCLCMWGEEDWGKYNADVFMFCYVFLCFMMFFAWCLSLCMWGGEGSVGGSITLMSRCSFKFATNCNQGRPSTQYLKRAKICRKITKKYSFSNTWCCLIGENYHPQQWALSQNNTTLQNCKLFVFNWPKVARKIQQECDIDVKLVEIWGNCAVWWSVALSTYDLPSVAVPYSSQSCRHLLHIFTNSLKNARRAHSFKFAVLILYQCPAQVRVADIRFTRAA